MKRVLLIVLLVLLVSGLAAGVLYMQDKANSDQNQDGRKVVEFWSFWGSETRRPIIEKMIDDYNASQNEVRVKHTFIPFGDIWTKELAAVASKNKNAIPDVVVGDINAIQLRAKKQQIEPLNPLLDVKKLKSTTHQEAWKAVTTEDTLYAAPFTLDTRILFYNKKMLRAAGFMTPPKTWSDLEKMNEKITKTSGSSFEQVGFHPLFGVGADVWLINTDGRNYLDNGKVTINTPEDQAALEWINRFNQKMGRKKIDVFKAEFGEQQANPFLSQKVAMYADVPTFYTQIRDYAPSLDFGVVPLPERKKGSGHYSWSGGFALEIPKGAKHPKEAAKFIAYMTSKEAQMYWAEKNYDQVANTVAAHAVVNRLEGDAQDVYQVAETAMKTTLLTPTPVEVPDLVNLVNPEIEKAVLGKSSPKQALQNAQEKVEQSMAGKKE